MKRTKVLMLVLGGTALSLGMIGVGMGNNLKDDLSAEAWTGLGIAPDAVERQLNAMFFGHVATQVRESALRITDVRVRYPDRVRFGSGRLQKLIRRYQAMEIGIIGRVTLGYVASAMFSDRLPAVIRRFQRDHHHIELTLVEKTSLDQIAALHERQLDVGVLRKPDLSLPESVAMEEWHQSLLIAAIPKDHELAKLDGVRISDLRDQPIITYPRDAGIGLYWPFLQLCAKAGFQPNVVKEAQESCASLRRIFAMMSSSAGSSANNP